MEKEKPGFKTTEFWLSAAASLLGLLAASGLLAPDGSLAQAVGLAVAALAALGYSHSRSVSKAAVAKAAGMSLLRPPTNNVVHHHEAAKDPS